MERNKPDGFPEWVDPDDAPELTDELLAQAEVFHGNTFVRRGDGRPIGSKENVQILFDPDVLAKLRQAGPGWQAGINALLRQALNLPEPNI